MSRKPRPEGGFIPKEEFENSKSTYEWKKDLVEERTGVQMTDAPYEPSERDAIIDTYLEHWPNKPKIHSILIEMFPNRSGYFASNNNLFEQFVARRKNIKPVKRPTRRSGTPWTAGDYEVFRIVARRKNVEKEMCDPQRVAYICRREVAEITEPLEIALEKAGTYDLAWDMDLVE